MKPVIRILRVRGEADADLPLPEPATKHSSGVDLRAAIHAELELAPGQRGCRTDGVRARHPAGVRGSGAEPEAASRSNPV